MLSTLGIVVAASYSANTAEPKALLMRIVTFPPLLATVTASAVMPVDYPEWLLKLLQALAATVGPLALVSVKLQLRLESVWGNVVPLLPGLAYKLLLSPPVVCLIYVS